MLSGFRTRPITTMPPSTLVTVVIPCHNQAHFLGAAVASVARQTWPHVETLVVDDGSSDDTAEVAVRAGAVVLRQNRGGVGAARNRGLAVAHGDLVIFLDADDELEPDAVASGVALLDSQPSADMAARCCVLMDAAGRLLPTRCDLAEHTADLYAAWLARNLVWTPGAAVFRRAALAAIGGFPEDIGPAADYAVYLHFARHRHVAVDARPVVRYRQHASNMSRDAARMLEATLRVLAREAPHVPPQYRRVLREGRRAWCTFYGEEIVQGLRADIRAGRLGAAQVRAAAVLLRRCCSLAFGHAARKLGRVAGGHRPTAVEPGRFTPPDGDDRRAVSAGEPA